MPFRQLNCLVGTVLKRNTCMNERFSKTCFKCLSNLSNSNVKSNAPSSSGNKRVTVTFADQEGRNFTVQAEEESSLLEVVWDNNLDFGEFGVCEGNMSCATCHVVLGEEDYNKVPQKTDTERTMMDIISSDDIKKTSRLGCQVKVTKEVDGMVVYLPSKAPEKKP